MLITRSVKNEEDDKGDKQLVWWWIVVGYFLLSLLHFHQPVRWLSISGRNCRFRPT